ncbi:hypothetical protein YIM73518_10190 [Thermus brockianus]|uniref:Uncharacterized protein n=1 Tax=Thermus brockianus TaxID=56956 RepID=A0ABN6NGF9_THEBO|nr:hypothetical protein TbrSNM41_06850 [Thermus brockianus]
MPPHLPHLPLEARQDQAPLHRPLEEGGPGEEAQEAKEPQEKEEKPPPHLPKHREGR